MQGHVGFERHVFPRPAVELNHARAARHQPAIRRGEREQHAVRARDRNDLAVGIDRDDRPHVRIELADLLSVDRRPDGVDLDQAHVVQRLKQPRIDVLAGQVDDLRVRRDGDVLARAP